MNLGPEAQRATSPIIRSALKSSCRHFMCVFFELIICNPCSLQAIDCFLVSKNILQLA